MEFNTRRKTSCPFWGNELSFGIRSGEVTVVAGEVFWNYKKGVVRTVFFVK